MADSQPPEGLQPKIAPFVTDDVDAAVTALANNAYLGEEGPLDRNDLEEIVSIVLSNASARGRLLPSGGEVSTQYGTRLSHPDRPDAQPVDDGPLGTLEDAKEYGREHVARGWVLETLLSREVRDWPGEAYYCGPWSPVLSDNTEGQPQ